MSDRPLALHTTEARIHRASRAVVLASFLSALGFNFVFPLIPLYMRELAGPGPEAAIWAGFAFAAAPMAGAIASPIWGRLADRVGYRPMLLRALISTAIVIALISLPNEPWQLVLLRALSGGLGSFQAVAMGALSSWSRPEDLSRAISRLQMAQVFGIILGPAIGGTIAAVFGIRFSPLAGGLAIAAGVVLVARWLHEPHAKRAQVRGPEKPMRPTVLWLPILTLLAVQFTESSFNPILPLLLAQGSQEVGAVAGLSGAAYSLSAVAAALGAAAAGRAMSKGVRRGVMLAAMGLLVAATLAAAVAPLPWGFVALRIACGGLAAGLTVSAYSAGGLLVQPGQFGAAYGWLASSGMMGFAASPVAAGFLAAIDLRAVLALDAVLCLVGTAGWMRARPVIAARREGPRTGD